MSFVDYTYWTVFFILLGLVGMSVESRSIIYLLCFVEILFLGLNMSIILYTCLWQDIIGLIFSFFILSLTAVETSVGLALVFLMARSFNKVNISNLRVMI